MFQAVRDLPQGAKARLKEKLPIKIVVTDKDHEEGTPNPWASLAEKIAPTVVGSATGAILARMRGTPPTAESVMLGRIRSWLPVRVISAYGASQAGNYASALAFAGFLAMFPMMLGALSIVGMAIRDPATEAQFANLLVQLFPNTAQAQLTDALHGVKQSAGWMGLVSLGGLIWSASGIFSTMEFAFTQIFGTKQRDMLRQKAMGFVMIFLLVVAIAATVAANGIAALFPMAWVISFIVGAVVMVGLLVLLYRFVPNRTFRIGTFFPGAILAGRPDRGPVA